MVGPDCCHLLFPLQDYPWIESWVDPVRGEAPFIACANLIHDLFECPERVERPVAVPNLMVAFN